MSKPPRIVIPGLNRGAGIRAGFAIGRRRGTGQGPAELLNLLQMRGQGLQLVSASNQQTSSAISSGASSVGSLSTSISTSLSTISSSITSLSSAVSGSISSVNSRVDSLSTAIGAGGPFLPLTGGTLTGELQIQGSPINVLLQASNSSNGFSLTDRITSPGRICDFVSEAPVAGGTGMSLALWARQATTASKTLAQVALYTTPPLSTDAVRCHIRAAHSASGEELQLATALVAGALTAGDIVFLPNNAEEFRIHVGAGVSGRNLSGTNTGDETAATIVAKLAGPPESWVWAPTVDGSSPPVFILDGSNQLIMTRIA